MSKGTNKRNIAENQTKNTANETSDKTEKQLSTDDGITMSKRTINKQNIAENQTKNTANETSEKTKKQLSTDDRIGDNSANVQGVEGDDEAEVNGTKFDDKKKEGQDGKVVETESVKVKDKAAKAPKKDHNAHHKDIGITLYVYIILGISIIVVLIASTLFSKTDNEVMNIDRRLEIDQLFQDFKNQPARSAKKLRSRVRHYLDHTRSPQPFVLLVAAMQENQMAANCFADRVGKIINSKPLMINGSLYSDTSGDKVKLEIDKKLRNVFQKGKFPTAAIIYNLNLLPYNTLNLFYAYCDHDNPIFKEATIIFTVMLPLEYHSVLSSGDDIKREGIVESYLQEEWSKDDNFDENMMGALLSRISDTVIVVTGESKESLEQSCSIK